MSTEALLKEATRLEAGGDLLSAYDAVTEGLLAEPGSIDLRHRAVLLLARGGAIRRAQQEYDRLGLARVRDHMDSIALGGRLLKDLAFAASGEARRIYARESAAKYAQAYALGADYYPCINWATMTLLAGDAALASRLAQKTLESLERRGEKNSEDAYYRAATRAEACILLGRLDEAEQALAGAFVHDPGNHAAHAGTMRQMEVLCVALGFDRAWLDRYSPPPALAYCGHMFGEDMLEFEAGAKLRSDIATALTRLSPSAAFGSLAAGADIVIAEAVLAQGAELHVVLPMEEEIFLARSITPYGPGWRRRYLACKARAASFRLASRETDLGDDTVFAFSSEYAMGLAIGYAEVFRTVAHHLAVWDGSDSGGVAGTGADVRRWRTTGRPQQVLTFARQVAPNPTSAARPRSPRRLKAMLFGDVRGFSKLREADIGPFVEQVLAPLAHAALAGKPDFVATWGDGTHLICPSVAAAADIALAMQDAFAQLNLAAAELPDHLALRIGGHFGPVAQLTDPFLAAPSFYGTHITIAARIEPMAVPGTVYVSEPFAALLALEAPGRFATDYVGKIELPKGFGTMRLFALHRSAN